MKNNDLSRHFSNTFGEARGRVLALAGGPIHHHAYTHPLTGPGNHYLSTDILWCGPQNARGVLLVSSGLHGIEGFAGSAIQNRMLSQKFMADLPPEMAVVFVHALNPHGFAFQRRVNEDNIDLNRNFIDWTRPPPADHPLNDKFQSLLLPGDKWRWPLFSVGLMLIKHGRREIQNILQQGQYSRPDGIFYGGAKAAWSNAVWRDTIARWAPNAQHVVHVDIHTGLGPYGHGELITTAAEASAGTEQARAWFGDVRSTSDGSSVSAHVSGSIEHAFNKAAGNRKVTSVALEFGTLPPVSVLKALAFDNWAHVRGKTEAFDTAAEKMRNAFAPKDPEWQRKVIKRGEEVLLQAKAGLVNQLKFG